MLSVVTFRRSKFIIYGREKYAAEASIYSPCGGVIPLYVEYGIVQLSSHLFSIMIHNRSDRKDYIH